MFKTDKNGKKDCTYALKHLGCIETRTDNSCVHYCEKSDQEINFICDRRYINGFRI